MSPARHPISEERLDLLVTQVDRGMAVRDVVDWDTLRGLIDRIRVAEERLAKIQAVVDEQAEDEGLWCRAEHIFEDYLQLALRRLHRAIEAKANAN